MFICALLFVTNKNLKVQNILLLIASYIFMVVDWRFLLLLAFLSLANYLIGIAIESNETNRKGKIWLIIGLITNLVFLGFLSILTFC